MDDKTRQFQDALNSRRVAFRQMADNQLMMAALSILLRALADTNEITTWALIEELQRRARGEEVGEQ